MTSNIYKYTCDNCNFYTINNYDYNKHLLTKKHIKNSEKVSNFECLICKKKYFSYQGLWKHKKSCKEIKEKKEDIEIVNTLIEQNKKIDNLEKLIIELSKKAQIAPVNNLNINFFLNEQCKNAVNMIDFVKSIIFELKDYENIQDKGFIENKTSIILENLNKLTVYERPLHYIKNEEEDKVIHIRDKNMWKLETEERKPILENALDYLNEKEFTEFFEVYKKKTNGDVREDKDFESIKNKLIKEDNKESKQEIIGNILENVVYPK